MIKIFIFKEKGFVFKLVIMVLKITSSPVIRQYLVIFILNLNVLSAGYGMAWPSPMMVKLRNSEETVLSEPITLEQGSWVISSGYLIGALGRKDESMTILTSLRGCEIAAKEEIKQYDLMNTTKKVNKLELYKQKLFWKSLGLTVTTNVGTQFLGYFAIGLYLQTILESTHSSMSSELSSVIIGAVQIVASIFTATTTDKFGRKPILTVSILGMMVGMICLGVFFYETEGADVILGFMNYLPLIAIAIIIFCYSAGPGSINSVLCAELFDNNARTLGVTLNMSLAGIAIFVLMKLFPFIVESIGPAITYWIFAFNCLLLCTFIAIFIPETKGRSFVDIQRKLGAKIDSGEEKTEIS